MIRILVLLFWSLVATGLLCPAHSYSQQENRTWHFGRGAAIQFNDGNAPQVLTESSIQAFEGVACISDHNTGRVLFYTNGMKIWDSTHAVMQNGHGLQGDTATVQSSIIVPAPCDTNLYYVFTNHCVACGPTSSPLDHNKGIAYSKVDMRMNGGRGAVVEKNVQLIDQATERLAVTMHENGRDYWVITQDLVSYAIHSYPLTCAGIGSPIISPADDHLPSNSQYKDRFGDVGAIQISPNGKRLALSSLGSVVHFLDVYKYDPGTGIASAWLSFPEIFTYQTEFSPDGSKLYWIGWSDSRIHQIDLTLGSRSAILASDTRYGKFRPFASSLQLGPDGKIYFSARDDTALSVVHNPNAKGSDVQVEMLSVSLGGKTAMYGLPNLIDSRLFGQDRACSIVTSAFDLSNTLICTSESVDLINRSDVGRESIRWHVEGADTLHTPGGIRLSYRKAGYYEVVQIATVDRCGRPIYDTVTANIVVLATPEIAFGDDLWICRATSDSIQLRPAISEKTTEAIYAWSPTTGLSCSDCASPIASPSRTTTYILTVDNQNGCLSSDSITIWVEENLVEIEIPSEIVIPGDTFSFPLILRSDIIEGPVQRLALSIKSDSSAFLFSEDLIKVFDMLKGTALDGWTLKNMKVSQGSLILELEDLGTDAVYLKGGDTLINIPGQILLGSHPASIISASISSPDVPCTEFLPAEGTLHLAFCGIEHRRIEFSTLSRSEPVLITSLNGSQNIRVSALWTNNIRLSLYHIDGSRHSVLYDGILQAGIWNFNVDHVLPGVYLVDFVMDRNAMSSIIQIH